MVAAVQGALAGLRVLDLSRVLAGPWASQMLGDLGADVVKVERPGPGDETRSWGPPWVGGEAGAASAAPESAYFTCANRNKRSIAIDLASADGQALVRRLALRADVLIENFKVGGLAEYGLDEAALRPLNPGLIYCSITGFGQNGPYANRPGYDALVQGMGGLMSLTGRADGEAGAGPQKVGVALTDILTGLHAVIAVLAALRHRERGGAGQAIDLALLDVQVASLANQAANYLVGGVVPTRLGNAHPSIAPYQDFPTADGHMMLAVGNDGQFRRFCVAAGRPEWAADARFLSNPLRVAHRAELVGRITELTRTRSTRDWVELLEAAGVPCGPINRLDAVFDDPQVQARGLRVELPGSAAPVVASPLRLSATPVSYRRAPPGLDQDRREILADWLGEDGA
jgi:crotonobetainyl-CoA:carnitine CoA-transferase CaiB-like acyl-CoA transferase